MCQVATHSSGGAIGLAEGVEDHGELVLRDTDTGVGHAELDDDVLIVHSEQTTAQCDVAL